MKPDEILSLTPARLRRTLSARLAVDPTLANCIETLVGFAPKWSKMNTCQYAQIALAWAQAESFNDDERFNKLWDLIASIDETTKEMK